MLEIPRFEDPRRFNEQRSELAEVFIDRNQDAVINDEILFRNVYLDNKLIGQRHIHSRLGVYAPVKYAVMIESNLDNPGYVYPPEVNSDRVTSYLFLSSEKSRIFIGYQYEVRITEGGGRGGIRLLVAHTAAINARETLRVGADPIRVLTRIMAGRKK